MYIKCKTDKGKKRQINEDYVLTLKSDKYCLLLVADGMGGHNAGEIASRIAAITVRDFVFEKFNDYENKEELLRDSIVKCNEKVFEESQRQNEFNGMGTTITCCLLNGGKLYTGHVGDSRAYVYSDNGLKKITQDHSLVQELINNGSITEKEAFSHPQRNVITRAIGTEKYIVVDTMVEDIDQNAIVILCTDGLTSYVSNEEIQKILMIKREEAVEELINLANERGGSDNISIVVARKEGGK